VWQRWLKVNDLAHRQGKLTNQCTRIANARFYNGYTPVNKWAIVATIANPQSRDFWR